jgi:two-component system OmpR family response regulator
MMRMMSARALVVEDEENVAFLVATALRLADFDVTETQSAREALRRVAEARPDVIVLDVMLPDLDGFEVCRRMRQDRIDVPVIFLTARDAIDDRVRGLSIGGDDYLTKPFSVEELVARVQAILRRSGKSPVQPIIRCGDLTLDDGAHLVTRNAEAISVSPTEYKLLRYLLRNTGRVVSREQILDHVWDYDFDGESTVVETFVSSLRKKINDDGPTRLIHTVRGVGYRLAER